MKPMESIALASLLSLALAAVPSSAESAAEQQDARVIANLVEAGDDITLPHDVDFFLVLPGPAQAKAAAEDIGQLGYKVVAVEAWPDGSRWEIHATRRMAPLLEPMQATTRELEALAVRHGGDYDGWGTAAVR